MIYNYFMLYKFTCPEELSLQNRQINNINYIDALNVFDIPNIIWINLSYNKIADIYLKNSKNLKKLI